MKTPNAQHTVANSTSRTPHERDVPVGVRVGRGRRSLRGRSPCRPRSASPVVRALARCASGRPTAAWRRRASAASPEGTVCSATLTMPTPQNRKRKPSSTLPATACARGPGAPATPCGSATAMARIVQRSGSGLPWERAAAAPPRRRRCGCRGRSIPTRRRRCPRRSTAPPGDADRVPVDVGCGHGPTLTGQRRPACTGFEPGPTSRFCIRDFRP